jgi:hypothetical protein
VSGYPAGSCTASITPVARESGTQVSLFLQYVPLSSYHIPCGKDFARRGAYNIQLRAPLGNRILVDGATGQATASISARLVLRPAALPDGFRLDQLYAAPDLFAQRPRPAGCLQSYTPNKNVYGELVIVQSAGPVKLPFVLPGPGGWISIMVRRHRGHAAPNVITWRENGLTDYVAVYSLPSGMTLLSTQQLIAIADSAPAVNSRPIPVPGS